MPKLSTKRDASSDDDRAAQSRPGLFRDPLLEIHVTLFCIDNRKYIALTTSRDKVTASSHFSRSYHAEEKTEVIKSFELYWHQPIRLTLIMILTLLPLCLFWGLVHGAETAEWKSRSIYQVMTDRYALTNGSTTAQCDTASENYCGGSWQGIINQLDYIENMGFTAVC